MKSPASITQRLRAMTSLIDSKEVVRLLGVGSSTLRLWTSRAEIPHIRLGRKVMFDPARLADWVEARMVGDRYRSVG